MMSPGFKMIRFPLAAFPRPAAPPFFRTARRAALALILGLAGVASASAQDTSAQEQKKERLEKEIEIINRQLSSNDSKSRSALSTYNLVSKKISNRQALLKESRRKERECADRIYLKQKEINALKTSYDTLSAHYERLVLGAYKNRDAKIWYMYILASEDLSQAYRRYGYFKSLASQISEEARRMEETGKRLEEERDALQKLRAEQKTVTQNTQKELGKLQGEQAESKALVGKLKKEKTKYQKELAAKKKQVEALDREIERLVREAMRGSAASRGGSGGKSGKTVIDEKLAAEFSKNRGKLPWPADGPVVDAFGERFHPVYKNVKLPKNNGVGIALQPGTKVRCVFDGVVKQVLVMPGYNQCVLVQHGNYFTFYCKLKNVVVKSGQKVKTGQEIGTVDTINRETQLHFQIWRDTIPQNPETWLK